MKKIVAFVIFFCLIYSSVCAFASDSFYFDDFSGYSVGGKPSGLTYKASNDSELYVKEAEVDGKIKNVLAIDHNSAIVSLIKEVGSATDVSAEIRFRKTSDGEAHPSLVLVARSNQSEVFRVYANSKDNRVVINSSLNSTPLFLPSNPTELYIEPDEWYTFAIQVDTVKHTASFKIKAESVKGLKLTDNVNIKYDTKEGIAVGESIKIDPSIESINDIRIFTGSAYQGIFEIDYIDISKNQGPYELIKNKPEPLPLPLTKSPEERLVPFVKNVVVNNKISYHSLYPISREDIWYGEYKKTFEAFGYTAYAEGDVIIARNEEREITLNYKTGGLTVDGTASNISPSLFNEEYIMIPITEVASAVGYNTRISDNAIFVSENELFGLKMSPYTFTGPLGIDGDDNIYVFHFGQRDNTIEEVGLEINGKKYKAKRFDEETQTKFGIGIADPSNKLSNVYTVTPYYGTRYGTPVKINKNEEGAVYHPVILENYYPEAELTYAGAYTTAKDYTSLNEVSSSEKTIRITGRPTGDAPYGKRFIKFDLNGLTGLSNGRRVYLYLYAFGTKAIISDSARLEVYGIENQSFDSENPPVRRDAAGPVGSYVFTSENNTFSGEGAYSKRIGIDVTSYIHEVLSKGEKTVAFGFKLTDFELSSGSDAGDIVIYVNHSSHGTASSDKQGILYNPTLHIMGSYENIDNTVYPEASFEKTGLDGMWYGSSFTSREGAGYTEVNSPANGNDANARLGVMQFEIPDEFTGVTKGKRIILDFYAYRNASCSSDVELLTVGTYNEVVMDDKGMSTYHIRSFEKGLLGTNLLTCDKQKISIDITDYVISKHLEGHKQFTIAFKVKYPDGITGTSNAYAYVHTSSAKEELRPNIRYE